MAKECSLIKMYENEEMIKVTGETIRPGGLFLTKRALKFSNFKKEAKILDVGCGSGATVEYLQQQGYFKAVGADPSTMLLARARQRAPQLTLFEATSYKLPFESSSTDGVFSECALSVMSRPKEALEEIRRVLKKEGLLIITDLYLRRPPDKGGAGGRELKCFAGALAESALKKMVTGCGFHVTLFEDHSRLLAELAARLIFAWGSLDHFWTLLTGSAAAGKKAGLLVKKCKPGYFLLIAQKSALRAR